MQLGQSAWGGKLSLPQSAHLVVTNLPSPRASQNRFVLEIGMLNVRVRVASSAAQGGASGFWSVDTCHLDLESTVT